MKDQNTLDEIESRAIKYQRALSLFAESVMKPDHNLRGCAHNQRCYNELMEIRQHVINYVATLKEIALNENTNENETIKLIGTKILNKVSNE